MRDDGLMMTTQAVDEMVTPTKITTTLTDYILTVRDEAELEIHGRLIGFASSFRDEHTHPVHNDREDVQYVQSGARCSACRWFEVRIFTVECVYTDKCTCPAKSDNDVISRAHQANCGELPPEHKYLVLTYGITTVPGESHKRRAVWTDSPYEIVEILTQRNASGTFLPATSARVLSQAAGSDSGIRDAYINRAVT